MRPGGTVLATGKTIPDPARHRLPRRGSGAAGALAAVVYLAASLLLHRGVLADLAGRATGWASSDSGLFTWWLHWLPWALVHGQNPLYTTAIGAPGGVNAMWNTTSPALALLLAPITSTAGPTAAFNVGMILGPVVSGTAAYVALRPYARTGARLLAGGFYAFCPFAVAHASVGHLNIAWQLLPPVLLWAVHETLVARRGWRAGVVVGVALAVQTGIYTQAVALGAVAVLVLAAVLVAARPGRVREHVREAARAGAAAVGVWVLICAYPLWLVLAGPGRPRGLIRDPATTGSDAAGLVVPTPLIKLQGGTGDLAERLGAATGEQGSYLGLPLLVLAVAAVVVVRSFPVRVAAAAGAVLALLSLGSTLGVLGVDTGVPLPWALVHLVPVLDQAEGARLAPFVALCAAVLLAAAADHAWSARGTASGRVVAALVVLTALSWVPSDSQQSTAVEVPAFFADGAPGLTADDVVTTWPRASGAWVGGADPMLWQSAAGFTYRSVDGYFIGTAPDRPVVLEAPATTYHAGDGAPSADAARADLRRRGVTTVLVVPGAALARGDDPSAVLRWTARVTRDQGTATGGVWRFAVR